MRHGWLTIGSVALGGISVVWVIVVVKVGGVTVVTAVNRMATAMRLTMVNTPATSPLLLKNLQDGGLVGVGMNRGGGRDRPITCGSGSSRLGGLGSNRRGKNDVIEWLCLTRCAADS
jgi:hypothetical protein